MQPADFCRRAERVVTTHQTDRDTRNRQTSLAHAAVIFTAITGVHMTERLMAQALIAVKLARAEADPKFNPDHYDDLIGYVALAGAARFKEQANGNED